MVSSQSGSGQRTVHNGRGSLCAGRLWFIPIPLQIHTYIFLRPQTPMTTDVNGDGAAYVFTGRHLFAFKSQLLQTPRPFAICPSPQDDVHSIINWAVSELKTHLWGFLLASIHKCINHTQCGAGAPASPLYIRLRSRKFGSFLTLSNLFLIAFFLLTYVQSCLHLLLSI